MEELYLRVFFREKKFTEAFKLNFKNSFIGFTTEYLKVLIMQFHQKYIVNKEELPDIPITYSRGESLLEIRVNLKGDTLKAFNEIKKSIKSMQVIKENKDGLFNDVLKENKIQNIHIVLYIINCMIKLQVPE